MMRLVRQKRKAEQAQTISVISDAPKNTTNDDLCET
jgi:hypothetical protein